MADFWYLEAVTGNVIEDSVSIVGMSGFTVLEVNRKVALPDEVREHHKISFLSGNFTPLASNEVRFVVPLRRLCILSDAKNRVPCYPSDCATASSQGLCEAVTWVLMALVRVSEAQLNGDFPCSFTGFFYVEYGLIDASPSIFFLCTRYIIGYYMHNFNITTSA